MSINLGMWQIAVAFGIGTFIGQILSTLVSTSLTIWAQSRLAKKDRQYLEGIIEEQKKFLLNRELPQSYQASSTGLAN